jgi:hypothetical protein
MRVCFMIRNIIHSLNADILRYGLLCILSTNTSVRNNFWGKLSTCATRIQSTKKSSQGKSPTELQLQVKIRVQCTLKGREVVQGY